MKEMMVMKKAWLLAVLIGFVCCNPAWADLSWKALRDVGLEKEPIDVAASADGQMVFILVPGEVLVYSIAGNAIERRISLDKDFDRVAYAPGLHALVVTAGGSKTLRVLMLQDVHDLDLSGLSFKGPENAPVTIAVFSGYQ
jgi:hypothetical protein